MKKLEVGSNMQVKTTFETYTYLCNTLDEHTKVYYSRFGDGDFNIMRGLREKMHQFSVELQEELISAFQIDHEQYIRGAMLAYPHEPGMTRGVFSPPDDVTVNVNFLKNNLGFSENQIFDSHIMFHYISVFNQKLMLKFLDQYIRPKRKMFVGSVPSIEIERLIGPIDYYVHVPERDAYYTMDEWYEDVLMDIDDVELCLPAAGMAGRVLNLRLWNLNKDIHSIDLGSVIDAACGKSTRTWIDRVGYNISNLLQ